MAAKWLQYTMMENLLLLRDLLKLLKTKDKHTIWISKDVYIDKLDDIVNRYNNKYPRIIKMKDIDFKVIIYIDLF